MARHSFEEHTSEVEFHLEGNTLVDLFAEAASALAEVMGGPIGSVDSGSSVPKIRTGAAKVRLEAPDRNALLVDWLNELIYLSERDKKIFDDVELERLSDHALEASVVGREIEDLRLHVKAATFHGLHIQEISGGFVANVVLDV